MPLVSVILSRFHICSVRARGVARARVIHGYQTTTVADAHTPMRPRERSLHCPARARRRRHYSRSDASAIVSRQAGDSNLHALERSSPRIFQHDALCRARVQGVCFNYATRRDTGDSYRTSRAPPQYQVVQ